MRKHIACYIGTLTLILIAPLDSASTAQMQSPNYRIHTAVFSGGGAPVSSNSFQTNATLGQPSPLMDTSDPPNSTSYDNYPGFWYTLDVSAFVQGDCNEDAEATSADVTCTIIEIFNPTGSLAADCNGDGSVTSADVTCTILCIFGMCP